MIPTFKELFIPLLKFLEDKKEHSMDEEVEYLAKEFNLTEEERNKLLPSGTQTVFRNRLGWARAYLHKAGLIGSPKRGWVVITEVGLNILKENPDKLEIEYLLKIPEFQEFYFGSKPRGIKEALSDEEAMTPEEIIAAKIEEINHKIKGDLLDRILKSSPKFFEKLVIDLVVKMGYGGSFEEVSELLGKSGDEGVDGVIKEDILGLDNVYLQAKRWEKGSIGRPEIQSFVGALTVKGAKKGIFIAASNFTKDAIEYAESSKEVKVVLIDRDKLLDYMIKYNIGVDVQTVYEIKKVDEDYFEELI